MSKRPKRDVWDTFGLSLGYATKTWIKAYGYEWQQRLAEAVLIGRKSVVYTDPMRGPRELKVPKPTPWFRSQALKYLIRAGEEQKRFSKGHPSYRGKNYPISDKQDLFNLKVFYGNRKMYDTKAQIIIERYKEELLRTTDFKTRRQVKRELENFKAVSKRKAWEVIYEREGNKDLTPLLKGEKPKPKIKVPDYKKAMGRLEELAMTDYDLQEEELSERAMDEAEARAEGRWDEQVKKYIMDMSGNELFDYPSRIVKYLDKTKGPYRKDLVDLIRKHKALQNLIEAKMGKKKKDELMDKTADDKYTTTTFKMRGKDVEILNKRKRLIKSKHEK